MKKRIAFISFVTAFLLCIVVMAGFAFAVTPNQPMNDFLFDEAEVEQIDPFAMQGDGLADDVDIVLDQLRDAQEANELIMINATTSASQTSSDASVGAARAPVAPQPLYETNALVVDGVEIPYTVSYQTETAPANTAGLWLGSDEVNDGSWGYFIGHNPGVFTPILSLHVGSPVQVKDSDGYTRTYYVVSQFDVDKGTTWKQVEHYVTGYGESIIMQTCINGGNQYRIMVAA